MSDQDLRDQLLATLHRGGELQPLVERVYVNAARQLGNDAPIGVDWGLVNEQAAAWAKGYTFDLVKGVDAVSQERLQRVVGRYYEDGLTQGDLRGLLEPLFGAGRARMIAVTEVTRASAQGELAIAQQVADTGLAMVAVWQTNNDDLVCPVCGPLNGQKQGDGWNEPPPAHVNCRCWVNHEIPGLGAVEGGEAKREAELAVGGGGPMDAGTAGNTNIALHDFLTDPSIPLPKMQDVDTIIDGVLQLHNQADGLSYNVYFGNVSGQALFAVSPFPDLTVPVNGRLTPVEIENFIRKYQELLGADPRMCVGVWYNRDAGITFLDVSLALKEENVALQLGKEYNQLAIFNLKTLEEIPTGGTGEPISNMPPANERIPKLDRTNQ